MNAFWVRWTTGGGSESKAHAVVQPHIDLDAGAFPVLCGRTAPDGWDATIVRRSDGPRCGACERKLSTPGAGK